MTLVQLHLGILATLPADDKVCWFAILPVNPLAYSNARGPCEPTKVVETHTPAMRAVLSMPFEFYSSFLSVDGMTCRTSS
jgi:hypothetical protein